MTALVALDSEQRAVFNEIGRREASVETMRPYRVPVGVTICGRLLLRILCSDKSVQVGEEEAGKDVPA